MNPFGGITHKIEKDDLRNVMKEFPKETKVLIVYRNMVIRQNIVLGLDPSNICVECILVGVNGKPKEIYIKSLFTVAFVCSYIIKNTNSLVVDNLSSSSLK